MTSELESEIIIDHFKNPRYFGKVSNPTGQSELTNPLCGDIISLSVSTSSELLRDIAFEGKGCSLSIASTSIMCELVKGKGLKEVKKLQESFFKMIKGDISEKELLALKDASALSGIKNFPSRTRCVLLPWECLGRAVE